MRDDPAVDPQQLLLRGIGAVALRGGKAGQDVDGIRVRVVAAVAEVGLVVELPDDARQRVLTEKLVVLLVAPGLEAQIVPQQAAALLRREQFKIAEIQIAAVRTQDVEPHFVQLFLQTGLGSVAEPVRLIDQAAEGVDQRGGEVLQTGELRVRILIRHVDLSEELREGVGAVADVQGVCQRIDRVRIDGDARGGPRVHVGQTLLHELGHGHGLEKLQIVLRPDVVQGREPVLAEQGEAARRVLAEFDDRLAHGESRAERRELVQTQIRGGAGQRSEGLGEIAVVVAGVLPVGGLQFKERLQRVQRLLPGHAQRHQRQQHLRRARVDHVQIRLGHVRIVRILQILRAVRIAHEHEFRPEEDVVLRRHVVGAHREAQIGAEGKVLRSQDGVQLLQRPGGADPLQIRLQLRDTLARQRFQIACLPEENAKLLELLVRIGRVGRRAARLVHEQLEHVVREHPFVGLHLHVIHALAAEERIVIIVQIEIVPRVRRLGRHVAEHEAVCPGLPENGFSPVLIIGGGAFLRLYGSGARGRGRGARVRRRGALPGRFRPGSRGLLPAAAKAQQQHKRADQRGAA